MRDNLEPGYDVPAVVGMPEGEIETPALIIDLDAFERNVAHMREVIERMDVRLRVHGKMHKSADIARYQIEHGGACGVCCQKVSEAEAFVRAGITDVLITNQVRAPSKIDRLAQLANQARIIVCVDDLANVSELSEAAQRHGSTIEVLVEIDNGAGRCGVAPGQAAVGIAKAVQAADGLQFSGIQAYDGGAQHVRDYEARKARIKHAIAPSRRHRGRAHPSRAFMPDRWRRWNRNVPVRGGLRRLQRAAMRVLRVHGRRLRSHPWRRWSARQNIRQRPLHPHVGHEPREAGRCDLRCRAEGSVR